MEALVRIMVTGAEGYLGGVVTQCLLRGGHEVVSIDTGYFANLPGPSSSSRDIRDLDVADLIGIDGIVHLAALSNDACSDLHQDVCVDVNEVHAVRLAHMARQHGIPRFVFASTCSVYGAGGGHPAFESDTVNPLSVYAATKHRAEQQISALASDGFAPVILRFATLFGPSPNMRTDLVVNRLAASAVTRGRIELTSAAANYRPILHVRDAAAAVEAAVAGDMFRKARCFNVAATEGNIQISQIARAVQDVVGRVDVDVIDTNHDPRSYAVDTALLEKAGLRFDTDLRSEIAALADYFKTANTSYEALIAAPADRAAALAGLASRREIGPDLRWTAATDRGRSTRRGNLGDDR